MFTDPRCDLRIYADAVGGTTRAGIFFQHARRMGLARLAPGRGEGRSGKTKICLSEARSFWRGTPAGIIAGCILLFLHHPRENAAC